VLAIVVDFDAVPGLANAALPQRSISHLLALHRLHELGWKAETVLGPGEHRDDEGGPPFGRGVDRRLECRQRRLKPSQTSRRRSRRGGPDVSRGSGREGSKSLFVPAAWRPSTAASQRRSDRCYVAAFFPLPFGRAAPHFLITSTPPTVGAAPMEAAADGAAAAAAARATKIVWLRLPNGRPRLWDTGGVAAGLVIFFLLPFGRPGLRLSGAPSPPAPGPPREDMDGLRSDRKSEAEGEVE
jgi:hypothetical protein